MLSNFHTHSTFCDGKNTPEEMVLEAIRLGCPAIGFSGHSNTPFDPGYCMDADREKAYRREVLRLQEQYDGRIQIFLGIEQDYYSAPADPVYSYRIGSVHYVKKDGVYLSIDDTPELFQKGVEELYGGDYYALCEDYYRLEADVINRTGCQIVGHFDLVTKFNEKYHFFDENHPRYVAAAETALQTLLSQGALLEINTGAMSRGWKTVPYPAPALLKRLGRQSAGMILSSDAHRKEDLLYGLPQAGSLAESCGVLLAENPFSWAEFQKKHTKLPIG